jgi:hypothetical protein
MNLSRNISFRLNTEIKPGLARPYRYSGEDCQSFKFLPVFKKYLYYRTEFLKIFKGDFSSEELSVMYRGYRPGRYNMYNVYGYQGRFNQRLTLSMFFYGKEIKLLEKWFRFDNTQK